MNEYSLFRLKFQYNAEDNETKSINKLKLEVLAQCVNYTDAEAVASDLIRMFDMNKFETCVYEIVKAKFQATDILGTPILKVDNTSLSNALTQHYFENEFEGLWAVEYVVYGDKAAKEKDVKGTLYIPATDMASAMGMARKVIEHNMLDLSSAQVSCAKIDNVEYIYLRQDTSSHIYERSQNILG